MSRGEASSEFAVRTLELADDAVELRFEHLGAALSWRDTVRLWQRSESWRESFSAALARTPFEAAFWECPPVTTNLLETAFRCVVLDAPHLDGMPCDARSFREHFGTRQPVVAFASLGRDATLIAPTPTDPAEHNTHLLRFLRTQPATRRHALWQQVGRSLAASLGTAPVWLSTCGSGVAWLHVRLDSRPKYYRHAPFRAWPPPGSG